MILAIALACVLTLTPRAAPREQTTDRIHATLRAVSVVPSPNGMTVVIEANASLPQPESGSVASRPRIYLDFTDVLPGEVAPAAAPPNNPLVRRVRVAEHSSSPLVTRVVIDLTRAAAYRIDSSGATHGRIVVLLDPALPAAPTAQPSRPIQPPATKAQPAPQSVPTVASPDGLPPTRTAQPPAPSSSAQRLAAENAYGARVSPAVVRLYALRPLLESIDRQADPLPPNLEAAVSEFEAVGKLLSGIKPPRSREGTHALLQRTCTMGARAARMRHDATRPNDPTTMLNAASAAAGALMMLDRANKDLAGTSK